MHLKNKTLYYSQRKQKMFPCQFAVIGTDKVELYLKDKGDIMEKQIINILKGYTADLKALLAMYTIDFIIDTVQKGGIVINEDCTNELNEII